MSDDHRQTPDSPPDASDVVDGPVGSAWLRDPATSGPMGADLDALPVTETDDESPEDASPTPERQEPDRVGVDWERTKRES
jgi:hypothetical protein